MKQYILLIQSNGSHSVICDYMVVVIMCVRKNGSGTNCYNPTVDAKKTFFTFFILVTILTFLTFVKN